MIFSECATKPEHTRLRVHSDKCIKYDHSQSAMHKLVKLHQHFSFFSERASIRELLQEHRKANSKLNYNKVCRWRTSWCDPSGFSKHSERQSSQNPRSCFPKVCTLWWTCGTDEFWPASVHWRVNQDAVPNQYSSHPSFMWTGTTLTALWKNCCGMWAALRAKQSRIRTMPGETC